ncbi:MAG: uroporphyrinogen decarboxylase family protein [candidate division KSB1 bacterium]|nr:uroporphyrinogen decarboxylase family protein [candidate division KSB1 bacterium]
MTDQQWNMLLQVLDGKSVKPLPTGFIIDSPWLPGWSGNTIIDYFSSDETWLNANLEVVRTFPEVMFFPGFWSEYGMCTEPSAFGARCVFPANEFPHAHKVLRSVEDIANLPEPDPRTDGLLPFMLNRLKRLQPQIHDAGHTIRFAVARGPLNIASYLMGSTELLTTMMMQPEHAESLMQKITSFLKNWLDLQMQTFPSIDGIFLLDDIIGFIGHEEFKRFGLPYFKALYGLGGSVRFLHNDAPSRVSAPLLTDMGVNLFNMGYDVPLNELKELTNNRVTLLGNLPPRDVLASGDKQIVKSETRALLDSLQDTSRIILSCGGGMPPQVSNDNIRAFIETVQAYSR